MKKVILSQSELKLIKNLENYTWEKCLFLSNPFKYATRILNFVNISVWQKNRFSLQLYDIKITILYE